MRAVGRETACVKVLWEEETAHINDCNKIAEHRERKETQAWRDRKEADLVGTCRQHSGLLSVLLIVGC